jgi:mannose-6-phosphate isomerase-like protein (cupin superfamily)
MKKLPTKIEKGWGYELHIHNDNGYCSKILHFNEGAMFSMHFHMIKHETWYVASGRLALNIINTSNASIEDYLLVKGDVFVVSPGMPHQLIAFEESEIFEASTPDSPSDSYRIKKGDSQK